MHAELNFSSHICRFLLLFFCGGGGGGVVMHLQFLTIKFERQYRIIELVFQFYSKLFI